MGERGVQGHGGGERNQQGGGPETTGAAGERTHDDREGVGISAAGEVGRLGHGRDGAPEKNGGVLLRCEGRPLEDRQRCYGMSDPPSDVPRDRGCRR
mmetsp:Transcript_29032/g.66489  ORF Transcript_29032/g.66489 Transcript_29032/m.66489 type:complete len:97 (-) Transcript_29032:17-307(-)